MWIWSLVANAAELHTDWERSVCHGDLDAARELSEGPVEAAIVEAIAAAWGAGPDPIALANLRDGDISVFQLAILELGASSWAGLAGLPVGPVSADHPSVEAMQPWEAPEAPVTLPMSTSPTGLPVVRIRVDGRLRWFGLDTGAGVSFVSSALVPKSRRAGQTEFIGHGQTGTATWGTVTLELDGVERKRTMLVFPKRTLKRYGIHGVLGWQLLGAMRVVFDGAKHQVTFAASPPQQTTPNLFWWGTPLSRGTMNGQPALLMLDTGGGQSAWLTSARERGIPLASGPVEDQSTLGLAGPETLHIETVPGPVTLGFGGGEVAIEGPRTAFRDDLFEPWCVDARVGAEVFRDGQLVLDAPNGVLELTMP